MNRYNKIKIVSLATLIAGGASLNASYLLKGVAALAGDACLSAILISSLDNMSNINKKIVTEKMPVSMPYQIMIVAPKIAPYTALLAFGGLLSVGARVSMIAKTTGVFFKSTDGSHNRPHCSF